MTISFAGPHHCLGTARRISDEVFAEVRNAALRHGGTLTLQQIEAVKAAYDDAAPSRFGTIECIFNSCMFAVAKESVPAVFTEDDLVSKFLYAHTSGIACAVFEDHFEKPNRAWISGFYRALTRFVVRRFDPGFPGRALAVYIEAGLQRGQSLSVGELVHTEKGRAAVRECLLRMIAEPISPQLVAEFCAEINESGDLVGEPCPHPCMAHAEMLRPSIPSKVTFEQAERFLTLLRHTKAVRSMMAPPSTEEAAPYEEVVFLDDLPDPDKVTLTLP